MSIAIENLQIGCTGAQLVAKINEIISALNGVEQTTDYENLTNKPSINGVTLTGNKTTENLLFELSDASDYSTLMATLATKAELTAAQTDTVNLASAAVQALLSTKMDVDDTNVVEATMLNENAYIYIVAPEGLRKVSVANISNNVALKTTSAKVLEKAISSQLQMLTISGVQNGVNVNFSVNMAYIPGTSNLFFNGQRMVLGTDYSETNSGFVMITHAPKADESLVFIAAV